MKKKIIPLIVIIFFTFCFFVFFKGLYLTNNYQPKGNIEKIIPSFSGKNLFDNKLINSEELFEKKIFYILNIWASWCAPCRQEHKMLMNLSKNPSVEIIGLNYKDNIFNAKKFIKEMGNPYSEILLDEDGIISIELGAYGVPETFIINEDKIIIKKFIGPLSDKSMKEIKSILK